MPSLFVPLAVSLFLSFRNVCVYPLDFLEDLMVTNNFVLFKNRSLALHFEFRLCLLTAKDLIDVVCSIYSYFFIFNKRLIKDSVD